MSRQLGRSIQRNTRGGGGQSSIEVIAVYEYALRCAILAASEDARNAAAAEAQALKEKEQPKQHNAIGLDNIVGAFTDLFADDNKPNKLSKELCRGLSKRIEEVTKRRDTSNPSYQDPQLLAALTQFQAPLNMQKTKSTGTINDLLLIFIKTSQHELLRAYPPPQPTGDKLNTHLAAFAGLLKETIIHDAPHFASPDIVRALEGFAAFQPKAARNDSGVSNRRPNTGSNPASGPTSFFENTPLVKRVQELFQIPQQQHTDTVWRLQPICTEQVRLEARAFFILLSAFDLGARRDNTPRALTSHSIASCRPSWQTSKSASIMSPPRPRSPPALLTSRRHTPMRTGVNASSISYRASSRAS